MQKGWSWQRLYLNIFKNSFTMQNSIKVQIKSLKALSGHKSKEHQEKNKIEFLAEVQSTDCTEKVSQETNLMDYC